jgi:hypothetical protein
VADHTGSRGSACPHGLCDGSGFVQRAGTAYACRCRAELVAAARERKRDAQRQEASRRARKGWQQLRANGYRPRGRRVGHARDRKRAIARHYRQQQVDRAVFERLWRKDCEAQDVQVSERSLETGWAHYRALCRTFRAKGQGYHTSQAQRAAALANAGRARCDRTMRRHTRRLERLGLIRTEHIRKRLMVAGDRDCIAVFICQVAGVPRLVQTGVAASGAGGRGGRSSDLSFVRPPSAAGAGPQAALTAPAPAGCAGRKNGSAPHGARDPTPALPPANGSTEGERAKTGRQGPPRPRSGPSRARPVELSPFAGAGSDRDRLERMFLELYELAADTEDEHEQDWAHQKLAALHAELGAGELWDALKWAAQQQARRKRTDE